jgi:PAS domain S-box-containing protein
MIKQKLVVSVVAVAAIVLAAVACDFAVNTFLFAAPKGFTPVTTVIITLIVSVPVCYHFIDQHMTVRRVKEELTASIADKDRAHEAARLTLERLRESEARYRMLTERATDIIIRYDRRGVIEFASPSVRQYGYEPDEIVGLDMADFVHPEDDEAIRRRRMDLTNGHSLAEADRPYARVRRADGEWIWVQGSPAPLRDEAGEVVGAVTVLRDVTIRHRIEEELRRRQAESEAAARAKSEFLANMTHELRTPLNAIIGFSRLLKETGGLAPAAARQIELVWDASQTLLGVVNDVLDFSKLEAGALELESRPFDPRRLADSTAALLAGQAEAKGLTLSVSASGPEDALLGDEARLRQVLLNLISNAIKFTAHGDIRIAVAQVDEGERRRLRVEVRDNGVGVPPDQQAAIFDRFTQADASVARRFGGTGLGLAICKRIVEAAGGAIGVTSDLGAGSTFWFEIAMPPAETTAEAAVGEAGPVAFDHALRLLVVDDNAVNRELIRTLLGGFDIAIDAAGDGMEAIEAAARAPYDLILMDVQMPTMDGLAATRRIRAAAAPDAPRVAIIAMTANVLPDQIARCLEAGMDDHLGKPINPAALLEALARWAPQEPGVQAGPAGALAAG